MTGDGPRPSRRRVAGAHRKLGAIARGPERLDRLGFTAQKRIAYAQDGTDWHGFDDTGKWIGRREKSKPSRRVNSTQRSHLTREEFSQTRGGDGQITVIINVPRPEVPGAAAEDGPSVITIEASAGSV